jgi:hypothetical protein
MGISISRMIMTRKYRSSLRKTSPITTLSAMNLTSNDPGSNHSLCSKRLATNCTSHGTSQIKKKTPTSNIKTNQCIHNKHCLMCVLYGTRKYTHSLTPRRFNPCRVLANSSNRLQPYVNILYGKNADYVVPRL